MEEEEGMGGEDNLKCFSAVMAAIAAQSMIFPQWSSTWRSTLTDHTCTSSNHIPISHSSFQYLVWEWAHLLSCYDAQGLGVHSSGLFKAPLQCPAYLCGLTGGPTSHHVHIHVLLTSTLWQSSSYLRMGTL